MRFPLFQEQIAACHEFDGVRKEKERLTAASLKTLACLVHNDAKVLDAAHSQSFLVVCGLTVISFSLMK